MGQMFVCLPLQSGWRVVQEGQWGKTLSFPSVGEGLDDDQQVSARRVEGSRFGGHRHGFQGTVEETHHTGGKG